MELTQVAASVMITDVAEIMQPDNAPTFVLNGIIEEGDGGKIKSEPGFSAIYTLPNGAQLIGHVLLDDNRFILFVTNNASYHAILLADSNSYEVLIQDACLDFSTKNPIRAEFKIINGCERVIYFVDGVNYDRSINIDKIDSYIVGGSLDCNAIKLQSDFTPFNAFITDVYDVGGVGVEVGSYQFIFRYEDINGNLTDFFGLTSEIPVIYGSYSDSNSGGAQNIEAGFLPEAGGKPTTTKSIKMDLAPIDTRFKTLLVYCIRYVNGDRVPVVNLVNRIPISSIVQSYTFTGYSGTETIDISEVAVQSIRYKSSKELSQVQGRLIRANLTGLERDWADYQRYANNVGVRFVVDEFELNSNPDYYVFDRTFLWDEVYALGIKWVFEDGTESPVFHIPGRRKDHYSDGTPIALTSDPNAYHSRLDITPGDAWDSVIVTNTDANFIGGSAQRYDVYNTAIADGNTPGVFNSGELAFYECSFETYPDIRDCNGVPIFPHDDDGLGNYTMHNIRHHKMPDAALIPHFSEVTVTTQPTYRGRKLGLQVLNVQQPLGTIGWKLVTAERNEFDKSVLDAGVIYNTGYYQTVNNDPDHSRFYFQLPRFNGDCPNPSGSGAASWYPIGSESGDNIKTSGGKKPDTSKYYDSQYYVFHGPKTKFENSILNATHLKYEFILDGPSYDFTELATDGGYGSSNYEVQAFKLFYEDTTFLAKSNNNTNSRITFERHVRFDGSIQLDNGIKFINKTQQECMLLKHDNPKILLDSHNTSTHTAYFVTLKRVTPNQFSSFLSLPYKDVSTTVESGPSTVLFNGDHQVGTLWFRQTMDAIRDQTIGKEYGFIRNMLGFISYGDINPKLRVDGEGINGNKSYENSYTDTLSFMFIENDVVGPSFDAKKPYVKIPNYYNYNKDYSLNSTIRKSFPLPISWEYCSECSNKYPNRLIYSDVAPEEAFRDNYRNYKANNYIDIPAHGGEIKGLFHVGPHFYIRCPKTTFRLPIGNRTLTLDSTTVQVGTGAFFSLPLEDIVSVDSGYAGSSFRFASVKTPHGVFYTDDLGTEVYKVGSSVDPVSRFGMHRFFKENLNVGLVEVIKDLGFDYVYKDSISDARFAGIYMFYDPLNERVFVHKRDYNPLRPVKLLGDPSITATDIVYSAAGNFTVAGLSVQVYDRTLFENKSFTISYDIKNKGWDSFHSYAPAYSFFDSNTMYTVKPEVVENFTLSSKILHKSGGPACVFYDIGFPFIVELVFKTPPTTTGLESISWVTDAYQDYFDGQRRDLVDTTFDKLHIYNNYQSTGRLNLIPRFTAYSNVVSNNINKIIYRTDLEWNMGSIRDMIQDDTVRIHSSNWTDIFLNYPLNSFQGYIDKVPLNIPGNTSQYLQRPFKGRWVKARFEYNGANPMTVDIVKTLIKPSFR
jgi:hypothetical protein